ncbi:class I SAM-dependent methyltransferase [Hymenobacter taeanensis]|uniref:Class I SAM-dependent methyltransferase n=1 Tax=Hymenobacter taeanensis TaxID=2735321 RepID=A0A6M6BCH6_9BACT|nr:MULTISPECIES: class I SAM-dependent methyltransferase [Hymenobacter]QJX45709.1 class I SAM-dependent methyltransferase [Hymenobacter taeanensis]UOQ79547.1 class I SAM-dependent methyltransferase [Hymenobacter sp. 5414T-23]
MLFQILSYLRFLLQSGNTHGLHSPFVFSLYAHVIGHDGNFAAYKPIEARRQELLQSAKSIQVHDFGAGSHTGAGRTRRIRDIARTAAKSRPLAQLLFRLVNAFQPRTIVELGTSLGLTTSYLAAADSRASVLTFEGCPQTATVARETFTALGLRNINLQEGNLDDTLAPALAALNAPVDFVFFDGNHRFEPTLRYFELMNAHRTEDSVFVLDDIHWSEEMTRAWEAIKQHPEVTLTIDLFFIGLVFFRRKQPKQHFLLRFDNLLDKLLERTQRFSA